MTPTTLREFSDTDTWITELLVRERQWEKRARLKKQARWWSKVSLVLSGLCVALWLFCYAVGWFIR